MKFDLVSIGGSRHDIFNHVLRLAPMSASGLGTIGSKADIITYFFRKIVRKLWGSESQHTDLIYNILLYFNTVVFTVSPQWLLWFLKRCLRGTSR